MLLLLLLLLMLLLLLILLLLLLVLTFVEFSEAHSGGGKLGTVFGKGGSGKGAMAGLGRFGKGALKGAKEAAKATASAAGVEILRGTELSEAEQQVTYIRISRYCLFLN